MGSLLQSLNKQADIFSTSYGDESAKSMMFDSLRMMCGFVLMFAYSTVMLGRLNLVESRCYLGVSGLVAVGMGVVVALSLTMMSGFPYTGIHGTVPFIALGLKMLRMVLIT